MVPETSTAAREIAIDKLLYLGKIRRWRENLMLKYGLPPISHLNCIVQRCPRFGIANCTNNQKEVV